MEQLLLILCDLCVIFFDLLVFTQMFTLRKSSTRQKVILYGGCALILAAYFAAVYIVYLPPAVSSFAFLAVPSLVLFFYLSSHRDCRFFLTFCFVDSTCLILASLGRYFTILWGIWGQIVSLALIITLCILVFFRCRPYFSRYHQLLEVVDAEWGTMTLASALIYFAMIFIAGYPKPLLERPEHYPSYLVFNAVVLACYAVFLQSITKTHKIHEQNKRLAREGEIYRIAYMDPLTGLRNRAAYVEHVNTVQRDREQYGPICCVVLDMNDLKKINDQMGHHMGDKALIQMACALKEAFFEPENQLFRLGGDEFFLLVPNMEEAEVLARIRVLATLLRKAGRTQNLLLSAAVGYAYWDPAGVLTLEQVFVQADQNMYDNKRTLKQST